MVFPRLPILPWTLRGTARALPAADTNKFFHADYFEIIHRMQGEHAVQSFDDWQQERGEHLALD